MKRRFGLMTLVAVAGCGTSATGSASMQDAGADVPSGVIIDARVDGRTLPDANGPLTFDPCVSEPLPGYDPVAAGLAACCTGIGPAHCVPKNQILGTLVAQLDSCDDEISACMPDPIILAGGQYLPQSCTSSLGNLAGACLSQCIPLVHNNPQTKFLLQDSCGTGELCIPCINPLDGQPTGACELIELLCPTEPGSDGGMPAADAGPVPCPYTGPPILDPQTLPACAPACGGAHCVPAALVPEGQKDLLASCTATGGADGLCAPDRLIETGGNFVPASCRSVAGAEGRCLSTCLPDVADKSNLLPQDVCAEAERCVPCFDPTADNVSTGACNIACDAPTEPPLEITCPWTGPPVIDPARLPSCAGGACTNAHCLPASLVPPAQQSQLGLCNDGSSFCAPDPIITTAGNYDPPSCFAFASTFGEGRCLSSCLPAVSEQPTLEQSDCAAGNKCTPCFDPFTGADTGACHTASCDAPNPGNGYTFPNCCFFEGQAQGRCVPTTQIPDGDEANLQVDACPAGPYLCVPAEQLPGGQGRGCQGTIIFVPYSGTCLSDCLDFGFLGGLIFGQGNCPDNHTCIGCGSAPAGSPGCD